MEIKGIKFQSNSAYDQKCIKAKIKEFSGVVNTSFLGWQSSKRLCTSHFYSLYRFDSVMKMNKKNYPQVYLEEYKYKIKKKNMSKFTDSEVELDSNFWWHD